MVPAGPILISRLRSVDEASHPLAVDGPVRPPHVGERRAELFGGYTEPEHGASSWARRPTAAGRSKHTACPAK